MPNTVAVDPQGVHQSGSTPVLAGVAAMSALAGSIPGSLGLGLAYVFGMVFPLLIAVLFWDRFELSRAFNWLPKPPRLRVGGRQLSWPDVIAATMFIAIGGFALYLAYTGQSTYLPGWLASWNQWATGVAGDLALSLRAVPVIGQPALLIGLAVGLAWAVYRAWRAESSPTPAPDLTPTDKAVGAAPPQR